MEKLEDIGAMIAAALPGAVTGSSVAFNELTVTANAADIVRVMTFLRDDSRCAFINVIDVTAIDWPARDQRFDVVYHLLSPAKNMRIRVKIMTDETTPVASIISV